MVLNITVFYICDSHPFHIFLEHGIESQTERTGRSHFGKGLKKGADSTLKTSAVDFSILSIQRLFMYYQPEQPFLCVLPATGSNDR